MDCSTTLEHIVCRNVKLHRVQAIKKSYLIEEINFPTPVLTFCGSSVWVNTSVLINSKTSSHLQILIFKALEAEYSPHINISVYKALST